MMNKERKPHMPEEIIPFDSFFLSFKNSLRKQGNTLKKLTDPYTLMFLLYGDYRKVSGLAESILDYPSKNLTNIRKKPNGASFPIDGYLVYYNLFKRPFSPNTENTSEDVRYKELDRYCKEDFAVSSSEKAIKTYLHNQAEAGQPLITPSVAFFNKFLESLTSLLQAPTLYSEDYECKTLWNKMCFYGAHYKIAPKTDDISKDVYSFINSEEAEKCAPFFISKFIAQPNDIQNDAEAKELIKYLNMCAAEECCFKKINDKSFKDNYSELCKKNWLYCARFFFISVLNYARKCQNIRKDKYAKNQVNAKSTSKQCEQPMLMPVILVPNPPEGMIGRDSYVERIKVLFSEKKEELTGSVVYLLGERGIGKTCIAEKFISQHKEDYQNIIHINLTDSFIDGVCNYVKFSSGVPSFREPGKSQREYFNEIIAGLNQISCTAHHQILFWIDNLDNVFYEGHEGEEDAFKSFISLPFDFLVCTYNRIALPEHNTEAEITVTPLEEDELVELYKTEYGPSSFQNDENETRFIRETNRYASFNTLAIAAIAAEACGMEVSPSEMYRRLTEDGIPQEEHQVEIENAYINKRGITLGELFRKMYNIANIKDIPYSEEILFDIGLLSPRSMDINAFVKMCGISDSASVKRTIKLLLSRNWISSLYSGETRNEEIYVHQLKADVYMSIAKEKLSEYVNRNRMLDTFCKISHQNDIRFEHSFESILSKLKQCRVTEDSGLLMEYKSGTLVLDKNCLFDGQKSFFSRFHNSSNLVDLATNVEQLHTKKYLLAQAIVANLRKYKEKSLSVCHFMANYNYVSSDSWYNTATYIADYCDILINSDSYDKEEIETLLSQLDSINETTNIFGKTLSDTANLFNRIVNISSLLDAAYDTPLSMFNNDLSTLPKDDDIAVFFRARMLRDIETFISSHFNAISTAYNVPFDIFCEINECHLNTYTARNQMIQLDKQLLLEAGDVKRKPIDIQHFLGPVDQELVLPPEINDDSSFRLVSYGNGSLVIRLPKQEN